MPPIRWAPESMAHGEAAFYYLLEALRGGARW